MQVAPSYTLTEVAAHHEAGHAIGAVSWKLERVHANVHADARTFSYFGIFPRIDQCTGTARKQNKIELLNTGQYLSVNGYHHSLGAGGRVFESHRPDQLNQ